ncbi:hypothetical protein [Burkholderia arboris]|uniref:hypothetical protein n=1 Tax=Burkholderia arboris TaxID=488730 RepID=UPI0021092035|nr:hypothetical protein [Burkholderia arboris]UTV54783.1 hypothetical protein NLX30_18165 [Burkholderia arboris]
MPPDFGSPVADQITPPNPNQGIQTLSNLMSLRGQQQKLQVGAGEAQQAQQQMGERQTLQQAMLSGKDPDGNSLKGADGQIDPVAMANFANKYMPLTGQGVQQSIIKSLSDRVALNDSVRGLGQNYRNDVSGIVRSAIGTQQTPAELNDALGAYAKQNPDAAPAVSRAQSLIGSAPANMPQAQRDSALQHLAMQFQPANTTAQEQAPATTQITGPGGGSQTVQVNPYSAVPMGAVGPETAQGIPLGERQTVTQNQLTGGPQVTTKNGQGQVVGITNAPTQGVYVPQPGDKEALPVLSAERDAARTAFTNAGLQHENNRIVLSNIDNVPATGPVGQTVRNIATSMGLNIGPDVDGATAYDMVGKGLERSALQAAQSMGPSTNAGLEAQIKANGSLAYTKDAIKQITRLNDSLTSGLQAYQPGLERAISANPSAGVFAKRQFDQAWGANFDPRIFEMYNAAKGGDTATVNSIVTSLGGKNSAQFKALMQKAANLNQLSNGGGLQ